MKLQNLSTRTFLRLMVGGASLTSILLLFLLYVFTKDIRVKCYNKVVTEVANNYK